MFNPSFKGIEFDAFKNESGSNSFALTPQKWIDSTNAKGIISKSGRYGGTFAHRDIAFEFATWISAEFKFYFIKEFQWLKADENDRLELVKKYFLIISTETLKGMRQTPLSF
tara:strand:- start:2139 stop:2474 length:336 start_codon:yes stop_codon:yes gene_type:complete